MAGTGEAAPQMSSQMPLLVCFLGEREGECWPLGGKAAFKPHGFGETVKCGYQGSLGKWFELQILCPGEPISQMWGQNKNTLRKARGQSTGHLRASLEEQLDSVFWENDGWKEEGRKGRKFRDKKGWNLKWLLMRGGERGEEEGGEGCEERRTNPLSCS